MCLVTCIASLSLFALGNIPVWGCSVNYKRCICSAATATEIRVRRPASRDRVGSRAADELPATAWIEFAVGQCYLINMTAFPRARARAFMLLVAIGLGLVAQLGIVMAAPVMQADAL